MVMSPVRPGKSGAGTEFTALLHWFLFSAPRLQELAAQLTRHVTKLLFFFLPSATTAASDGVSNATKLARSTIGRIH